MMSDIMERLKDEIASDCECAICELCRASLAEITALRKALKPFAEAASLARREGMMIRDLIGITEVDAAAKAMEGK
jgi:hypothetical protein